MSLTAISEGIAKGGMTADTTEQEVINRLSPNGSETMTPKKFSLGRIVATPGALHALLDAGQTADEFLSHHVCGDWGDLDDEDKALNDAALVDGSRILSAYITRNSVRLWVITEATNDVGLRYGTTLLLPEEY